MTTVPVPIVAGGRLAILGGGPTGAMLAALLQRSDFEVTVYEARPDPRRADGAGGRSINLALAARGIHALEAAGAWPEVEPLLVPMQGRLVHTADGGRSFQRYGQRPSERIYSVSRQRLNEVLLDVAERRGVDLRFEHRLESADFAHATGRIVDIARDRSFDIAMQPLLAADGAGSPIRHAMVSAGLTRADETALDHAYKELTIPADAGGGFRMQHDALHIWPRRDFMLIALPNIDGSFTATLFLARRGALSFESLNTPAAIADFLSGQFPDAYRLMPDAVAEFEAHPLGFLGTVRADPWNAGGAAVLLGDAAHAIVPFHGQGMNCCFEDCLSFIECLGRHAGARARSSWNALFEDFFAERKPNTDAIAAMALENYVEMREQVADPQFRLRQSLALELERRHPERFVPRYSMVMFRHDIPYAVAMSRGAIQSRLLHDLSASARSLHDVDFAAAAAWIDRDLAPLAPRSDPA